MIWRLIFLVLIALFLFFLGKQFKLPGKFSEREEKRKNQRYLEKRFHLAHKDGDNSVSQKKKG
jgi:Tfp pilus assembly protein PilO